MPHRPAILALARPDSTPTPAVRRAAALAAACGLRLWLVTTLDEADAAGRDRREVRAQVLARLAEQLAACTVAPAQATLRVVWTRDPLEALQVLRQRANATLVLRDIERDSVLRRPVLEALDWLLIRELPSDLMLVGPQARALPGLVLAAVDVLADDSAQPSLNQRVLAVAARCAAAARSPLDLVSVAPSFPASGRSVLASRRDQDAQLLRHRDAFRELAVEANVPPERRHRVLGMPDDAIARIADELGADLTVVGSTQRGALQRLLLGSTAESLLGQLHSDLLIVKPAGGRVFDFSAAARRLDELQPRDEARNGVA